ncbi:MAG TPA: hypothetical protein PKD72_07435 [Gemmatales bacterium]|nr:hypothetical protein [Gemmatales bacterium]
MASKQQVIELKGCRTWRAIAKEAGVTASWLKVALHRGWKGDVAKRKKVEMFLGIKQTQVQLVGCWEPTQEELERKRLREEREIARWLEERKKFVEEAEVKIAEGEAELRKIAKVWGVSSWQYEKKSDELGVIRQQANLADKSEHLDVNQWKWEDDRLKASPSILSEHD